MGTMTKAAGLGAMLREAIRQSGLTRNAISRRAGIEYSAMWRLMDNEAYDPALSTADKLAEALGLRFELRPVRRGKRKTGGA